MAEGADVAATMKDLKEMEISLTSVVDKRMDELRDMIAKLASAQASNPSASSVPGGISPEKPPSDQEVVVGENETIKEKSGKEEYHTVPPNYSPDPPIPHPHINNIGVPPKIDASTSFSHWKNLMCNFFAQLNELWRIVQKGYKPSTPTT